MLRLVTSTGSLECIASFVDIRSRLNSPICEQLQREKSKVLSIPTDVQQDLHIVLSCIF